MDSGGEGQGRGRIWVSGLHSRRVFLLDQSSGAVSKFRVAEDSPPTGGIGQWCGRRFVALYPDVTREAVVLQAGSDKRVIGPDTHAVRRTWVNKAVNRLTVTQPHSPDLVLWQWRPGDAVFRIIDITYDDLDDFADDHLRMIAEIIASPERQRHFLGYHDPSEGPWSLVGSTSPAP